MFKYILSLVVVLSSQLAHAQNQEYFSKVTRPDTTLERGNNTRALRYAQSISEDNMRNNLTLLASDGMEGRETGTPANDSAATYIYDQLAGMGLKATYQDVAFTFSSWQDADLFVNGVNFRHLWDFLSFPATNQSVPSLAKDEVVFLGYGIDDSKYSDYKKAKNLSGKVILINDGEPTNAAGKYIVSGTETPSKWNNIEHKLKLAKKNGVALVLIISEDLKQMLGENRRFLLGPTIELGDKSSNNQDLANHMYVSSSVVKAIIGNNEAAIIKARKSIMKGKSKPIVLKAKIVANQLKDQKIVNGKNVIGVMEGSDKKDEYVVISAHYDHIGKRGDEVYNGADDNGSGTTTVLEIAKTFVMAKNEKLPPSRSMIFLFVTGEEKGLLGSKYYSENPVYPLDKTMVDINIDMVGRIDEKYKNENDYIYVIGSDRLSTDLHKINEKINQDYSRLTLDYTYNSEDDPNKYYYRSDHYNFAKKGIPAIFFFNGTHEDYHQAGDEVEKIRFDIMAKRAKHIFLLAWELASMQNRIVVDGVVK